MHINIHYYVCIALKRSYRPQKRKPFHWFHYVYYEVQVHFPLRLFSFLRAPVFISLNERLE